MYTDEIDHQPSALMCFNILHVADKYLVAPLSALCYTSLSEIEVTLDNFWFIFEIFTMFDKALMYPCTILKVLHFLDDNAEDLVIQAAFKHLNREAVLKLVQRNFMNISEIDLYNCVVDWSRAECCRQKLQITYANQKKILGDILYSVRFLTMEPNEFICGPLESPFFSIEEKIIFRKAMLNKNEKLPKPWERHILSQKRGGTEKFFTWNFTYDSPYDMTKVSCQLDTYFLVFLKDILLLKLKLYLRSVHGEVDTLGEFIDANNVVKRRCSFSAKNQSPLVVGVLDTSIYCKAFSFLKLRISCFKGFLERKGNVLPYRFLWHESLFYMLKVDDDFQNTFTFSPDLFFKQNLGELLKMNLQLKAVFETKVNTVFKGVSLELC